MHFPDKQIKEDETQCLGLTVIQPRWVLEVMKSYTNNLEA